MNRTTHAHACRAGCAAQCALALVVLVSCAAPALAAVGSAALPQLRDPFERPPGQAGVKASAAAQLAASPLAPAAPGTVAALPDTRDPAANAAASLQWQPQLRAIVYEAGQDRSLANISGVVLGAGESVHGYRVIKIKERSVVVSKDGARLILTLDNRETSQ